ncbi:MAG TPA: phosphohistidine phosphatase SixA [Mariprofundaceae bacterium]|nr:phosphohistidine phosphatase SixA [Mariprofundaceae bacterium]
MHLYLVQHGMAKSREEDPERGLTAQGSEDTVRVAGLLSLFSRPQPARILHSGKARARQTAELIGQQLRVDMVEAAPDLTPDADPQLWAARLDEMDEELMLIGHLPHLERLASLLLCGDAERGMVRFSNAGVLCLMRDATRRYRTEWMLVPDLLRSL